MRMENTIESWHHPGCFESYPGTMGGCRIVLPFCGRVLARTRGHALPTQSVSCVQRNEGVIKPCCTFEGQVGIRHMNAIGADRYKFAKWSSGLVDRNMGRSSKIQGVRVNQKGTVPCGREVRLRLVNARRGTESGVRVLGVHWWRTHVGVFKSLAATMVVVRV
ncbi:hypothetical protein B0H10DRAFT_1941276 [Mycena sp. CBHHK59/15]|nr:hypothetical protein B0H10DRAFT_1941276 [Mycena sp. CBHHK59/15]